MNESFLTKSLHHNDMKTLANAMYSQHFKSGENIIKYGDIGDKYFILSVG